MPIPYRHREPDHFLRVALIDWRLQAPSGAYNLPPTINKRPPKKVVWFTRLLQTLHKGWRSLLKTHVFILRARNRKRSMDFDDSYFENDSDIRKKEDRRKKTNEEYYPKICEPEWFVTVDTERCGDKQDAEQILKHQADWLFMKKQFEAALEKYQQLLSTVTIPIIIHQVTASIGRCHVNLQQWNEALEYTKRSLQPPHDKDASQLSLLGQIHSNQGDDYAAVQAIQVAVCLQRYNYQLWMALSRTCASLSATLKSAHESNSPEAMRCHNKILYLKEPSVDIVKRAAVLLKPHFKLRHCNREEIRSTNTVYSRDIVAGGEEVLWIIDVLGTAVTSNDDQVCVTRLADSQIFHHFLMILSCASCLWARSLLTYCQRHSSSFHLSKVSTDMYEVQVMLSNHPQAVVMRMSQCVVQVYDGTIGTE